MVAKSAERIARRVSWLNDKLFTMNPIDEVALQDVQRLDVRRAFALLSELENVAGAVTSPSTYLRSSARRDPTYQQSPPPRTVPRRIPPSDSQDQVVERAMWLNTNVLDANCQIDADAIAAMVGLGVKRSLELCQEIEEKSSEISNPSEFLKNEARKEGLCPPEETDNGRNTARVGGTKGGGKRKDGDTTKDEVAKIKGKGKGKNKNTSKTERAHNSEDEDAPKAKGKGKTNRKSRSENSAQSDVYDEKVSSRAKWLNSKVFQTRPLDDEAIAAIAALGRTRALELLNDVEEKSDNIYNPSKYLLSAARRGQASAHPTLPEPPVAKASAFDGRIFSAAQAGRTGKGCKGGGKSSGKGGGKVENFARRLNETALQHNPIDDHAIADIGKIDSKIAMSILRELEVTSAHVSNATGFVKAAVKRELRPDMDEDFAIVSKRVGWLNQNFLHGREIDADAIGALTGMGSNRASEILRLLQTKSDVIGNPSGWIKNAAFKDGLLPPGGPSEVDKQKGSHKRATSNEETGQKRQRVF